MIRIGMIGVQARIVDDDDDDIDEGESNDGESSPWRHDSLTQATRTISGKTILRGLDIYLASSHSWPRVTEQTHLFSGVSLIS